MGKKKKTPGVNGVYTNGTMRRTMFSGICDLICLTKHYYSKWDVSSTEKVKFITYLEAKSQYFT